MSLTLSSVSAFSGASAFGEEFGEGLSPVHASGLIGSFSVVLFPALSAASAFGAVGDFDLGHIGITPVSAYGDEGVFSAEKTLSLHYAAASGAAASFTRFGSGVYFRRTSSFLGARVGARQITG
jgi:hypothetical protein